MTTKTKTKTSKNQDEFVAGWEEIGAVLGVSGKTVRRAVAAGNRTLKRAIRNTNPGGLRRRPIAVKASLMAIREEVFPTL